MAKPHLDFWDIVINDVKHPDAVGMIYDKPHREAVSAVIILPAGNREDFPIGKKLKITALCANKRTMRDIPSEVRRNAALDNKGCALFVRMYRKERPLVGRDY